MSVKQILQQSKLAQLKRKMELDPVLREVKTVAEIVLEKSLLEKLNELTGKIDELLLEAKEEIEIIKDTVKDGEDGIDGENGEDYVLTEQDRKEIASKIEVPIVEKETIIEKTEVIKEQPIVTNEIKEVAKYETADEMATKLNTLEEKVEKKVIKGLGKELTNIRKVISDIKCAKIGGGGFSRNMTDSLYAPISSTNHANLSNLDYSSSGHTDFQQQITFSATAPADPYLYQLWVQIP